MVISGDSPLESSRNKGKEISFDVEKLWWACEEKALYYETKEEKRRRLRAYKWSLKLKEIAMDILKTEQKEIFLLVHYTYKSISDACKILGISYSVGYQRLRRARSKIKKHFELKVREGEVG